MKIVQFSGNSLSSIRPLFEGWQETLIWSCLQGVMGTAWAEYTAFPDSALIVNADFCFFAGKPCKELLRFHLPYSHTDFVILVPKDKLWADLIEETFGNTVKKAKRYAFKKEPEVFDMQKLQALATVPKEYQITFIDENLYHQALAHSWSQDLCSQYKDYEDYAARGLGVGALKNGVLVAGASSYTVYDGGIEIEIDTQIDHRRKGLATACGSRLILECLSRGLYPSWDAHNLWSVALAQKLGYHLDYEYIVYEFYPNQSKI